MLLIHSRYYSKMMLNGHLISHNRKPSIIWITCLQTNSYYNFIILHSQQKIQLIQDSINLYMDISLKLKTTKIFKKSLTKAPPCIQQFMLAMKQYNFTLSYIPGKDAVVSENYYMHI